MNLEEIARLAGVSRSTVSRVINEDRKVSDEVRSRVQQIIRDNDFHPNAAARSLATRRSRIIGLLIPQEVNSVFSDAFFPTLIQGVIAVSNAADHSLMMLMEPSEDPAAAEKLYRRVLSGRHVDGVIIASSVVDDPLVLRLLGDNFPFLLVGRHPRFQEISFVDVDNKGGALAATQHLLEHGYKRVAILAGPRNMIAFIDRLAGYHAALDAVGLVVDPALVAYSPPEQASGYSATKALLAQQPDAIFASSDTLALGAMQAIQEAGLRVPEDVALVGFDDLPLASRSVPPLTTVRQDITELGREAVRLLLQLLELPEEARVARHVLLPTQLVIRRSCGCTH